MSTLYVLQKEGKLGTRAKVWSSATRFLGGMLTISLLSALLLWNLLQVEGVNLAMDFDGVGCAVVAAHKLGLKIKSVCVIAYAWSVEQQERRRR